MLRVAVLACFLLIAAPAAGKGIIKVEVCGTSGCVDVTDRADTA